MVNALIANPAGFDYAGSVGRGNALRVEMENAQRQRDYRNMLAEYGPGIAQGDPAALGQLAQFDPGAALDVQSTRQTMDIRGAQEGRAAELHPLKLKETKMRMSAAAAEAARQERDETIIDGVVKLTEARRLFEQDPAAAWRVARDYLGEEIDGLEPNLMTPEGQAALGLVIASGLEGLSQEAQQRGLIAGQERPEEPAAVRALRIRAAEAGLQPGTKEYQTFMLAGGQQREGMALDISPGGGVSLRDGVGAASLAKPPSESQARIRLFGGMMTSTGPQINALEETYNPANLADQAAARAGWAGNYMRSEDAQRYEALGKAWAEGALRMSTGAAATQPEIDRIFSTYFAQPGDTPETIALKQRLRAEFEAALDAASGGYLSQLRGESSGADQTTRSAPATNGSQEQIDLSVVPEGVSPDVWSSLNNEKRLEYYRLLRGEQ